MLYNIKLEMCAILEGYIMVRGTASIPGVIIAGKTYFRS